MRKYPIVNILIKNKIITNDAVKQMMLDGENSTLSESELLDSYNIVKEPRLLRELGNIFHLEVIPELFSLTIPEEVFDEIPTNIISNMSILPISSTDTELTIAVSDPTDISGLESLSYYTQKHIVFKLAMRSEIIKLFQLRTSQSKSSEAINTLIEEFTTKEELIIGENIDDDSDAPTIQLTNSILMEAITSNASDIHVEPYESYMVIRYRIDGSLEEMMHLPVNIYNALIARFKLISGMDIAERRVPQEGRLEVRIRDVPVDIRFSTIPNVFGEKLVMRILQKEFLNTGIDKIGFDSEEYDKIKKMLERSNGIILVTGPTGSGKSTTLYSFLNYIKTPQKSIVTVEDPVEYTIDGFNQTQVNLRQGLTFPKCLRAILRQDPDIIMIGEIRDEETAEIAVRASITGHLVLSTLHTNTAVSSISRMINMGIEPYLISDSLRGVIAQRLMRRLCPDCKEKRLTTPVEMKMLKLQSPKYIYHAVGCKACNHTGYKGRFAVFEVLYVTSDVKAEIQNSSSVSAIENNVLKKEYSKLYDSGVRAVLHGDTTIQELKGLDQDE